MPFKFKIRKTRHYSVISRNVLVLTVELIDKTTLECTLSANSTGLDCLNHVCQRINLLQPNFFGLRYTCKRPYPKVRWVEMEKPLKKQLEKYAQSLALSVAVQFYIHDVGVLQDEVTRTHYFLQVKQDVLDGKMRCNYEQAVLLASYSLQADFGDHQPERHTSEYLKEFRLFPKHVMNEGEMKSLLDAVVWQYSSLSGLSQALAETYYILEAQRLPGYGQETYIARDDKGCEVYLGASLLGIVIESAAGAKQIFFRWNDITNLVNHKRSFGIECGLMSEPVRFVFEEPDAAKYIWKMCVKQHTFFKRNQEPSLAGGLEARSLVVPDLQQSSVVGFNSSSRISTDSTLDATNQSSPLDATGRCGYFDSPLVLNSSKTSRPIHQDIKNQTFPSSNHPAREPTDIQSPNCQFVSPNLFTYSFRKSSRRARLPLYRDTPDYEAAILHKYGARVGSDHRMLLFYSSQPEISSSPREALNESFHEDSLGDRLQPVSAHRHVNEGERFSREGLGGTPQRLPGGGICSTYSTPDLAANSSSPSAFKHGCDLQIFQGYRSPPSYPFCKSSSNSTPDLVSSYKSKPNERGGSSNVKTSSTAQKSLGFLGSPKMSRTYENLSDLSDAVQSLRHELSDNKHSFLHSVPPSYSTDNLGAVYRVSLKQNVSIKNGDSFSKTSTSVRSGTEPIYQNVGSIFANVRGSLNSHSEAAKRTEHEVVSEVKMVSEEPANSSVQADNPEFSTVQSKRVPVSYPVQSAPIQQQKPPLPNYNQAQATKPCHTVSAGATQRQPNQLNPHVPRSPAVHQSTESALMHSQNVVCRPNYGVKSQLPLQSSQETSKKHIPPVSNDRTQAVGAERGSKRIPVSKSDLRVSDELKDPKVVELEAKLSGMQVPDEFESIPRMKMNADFSTAVRPDNAVRNRVKDILPYEENRVKLTPSKDNKCGYINASHLTASIGNRQLFYVCAQGPLSKTVLDFWQCVWETDVRLVVALCRPFEGEAMACRIFPYWPQTDNTSIECEHFRVLRKQSVSLASHSTCQLQLVHMKQRKSRSLWHLEFYAWDREDECPDNISDFHSFLEELSSVRRLTFDEMEGGTVGFNRNPPIMVHCSSGGGRSGLVILSDLLTEAARHNVPLEPQKLLTHLRYQRMSLVQSVLQYKYAYKILLSSLQSSRLI